MKFKAIKSSGTAIKTGKYYYGKFTASDSIEIELDEIGRYQFYRPYNRDSTFAYYFGDILHKRELNNKIKVI